LSDSLLFGWIAFIGNRCTVLLFERCSSILEDEAPWRMQELRRVLFILSAKKTNLLPLS